LRRKMSLWQGIVVAIMLAGPSSWAATYYLSPTGSDQNSGTSSGSPWLSPLHAANCGDVILAAAGNYSAANFASGNWGVVTCPAANNVAWLSCVAFDACKISITTGTLEGMRVSASYWGVQGWEVDDTAGVTSGGGCFGAVPAHTTTIHHIVFANDIANVCSRGGFGAGVYNNASIDYYAVVGNISYGAAATSTGCDSSIDVFQPIASDALPGTHIYIAGNFIYGTSNPVGCADGEGVIFDTFDGITNNLPASYAQQAVITNNISFSNGSMGIVVYHNDAGAGPAHAHIFIMNNTLWNNNGNPNEYGVPLCGELRLSKVQNVVAYRNIAATGYASCFTDPAWADYAYSSDALDGTSSVYDNVGWSATGTYSFIWASPGFSYASNNLFGTNPAFAKPVTPGAPNCANASSVPDCMAGVIANLTPTNSAITGYGYQVPSMEQVYDPFFPQWLCNVNLPPGLVTMGCAKLQLNVTVN
jgi:hypothetical protein